LLGAFVVVGAIVWLLMLIRISSPLPLGEGPGVRAEPRNRFKVERMTLMILLTLQLLLGMESWLARFYAPQADLPQLLPIRMHAEWIRTAHYLVGSMIFATTVSVALIARRSPGASLVRLRELEGAI